MYCPTLDDYTAALAQLPKPPRENLWTRTAKALNVPVPAPAKPFGLEMRAKGYADWYRIDVSFDTREAATAYADRVRRVQPLRRTARRAVEKSIRVTPQLTGILEGNEPVPHRRGLERRAPPHRRI